MLSLIFVTFYTCILMSSNILFGFFVIKTIYKIFIGIFKSLGCFLCFKDLNKYLSNFKLQKGRIAFKTT